MRIFGFLAPTPATDYRIRIVLRGYVIRHVHIYLSARFPVNNLTIGKYRFLDNLQFTFPKSFAHTVILHQRIRLTLSCREFITVPAAITTSYEIMHIVFVFFLIRIDIFTVIAHTHIFLIYTLRSTIVSKTLFMLSFLVLFDYNNYKN